MLYFRDAKARMNSQMPGQEYGQQFPGEVSGIFILSSLKQDRSEMFLGPKSYLLLPPLNVLRSKPEQNLTNVR